MSPGCGRPTGSRDVVRYAVQLRASVLAIVLLLGCRSSSLKPAMSPRTLAAQGAPNQGLAKPLAGPYPTLQAYCASHGPGDQAGECRQAMARTDLGVPGVSTVAVLYVSGDSPMVASCAIALQLGAGWYVSAPSQDSCREPSYIDLNGLEVEAADQAFVIHLPISWHSKNFEASADYRLTTFCGLPAGVPACLPLFVSKCEAQAPASDCLDRGYEATWTVAGATLTLDTQPRSSNELVPHGSQRLF